MAEHRNMIGHRWMLNCRMARQSLDRQHIVGSTKVDIQLETKLVENIWKSEQIRIQIVS